MKKWAVLAAAVIGAAVMLVSSAGATNQSLAAQLSTRVGANLYLVQHGLSPRGFVIQRGSRNYAGPNCPGAGWNCTRSTRVLQIATHAGQVNQTDCGPSGVVKHTVNVDCEIVQTSDGGSNDAECVQSSASGSASETCVVFQTTSGTGSNSVTVSQTIDTTPPAVFTEVPPAPPGNQSVTQYTGINQQSEQGNNSVTLQQSITLEQTTGSGATQNEDATQQLSVTQKSTTGNNLVGNSDTAASQSLGETAFYSAGDGQTITQNQNASDDSPNTNTGIKQTSDSGSNSVNLTQNNTLSATASGDAPAVNQTQGTDPNGGINSVIDQQSSGQSSISNNQTESQHEDTSKVTGTPVVTQKQFGPMFGGPQSSNPADQCTFSQFSQQQNSGAGIQHDSLFESCDTPGSSNTTQGMDQNDHSTGNSCSESPCDITLIDGVAGTCGGPCPQPPPPDPPQKPPAPLCTFDGIVAGPQRQLKILIQSQSPAGISTAGIQVDEIANATAAIPSVSGETGPIIVTATKVDQTQGSTIKLTVTDDAGNTTTCDPELPAVHKRHVVQTRPTRVARTTGLALRLSGGRVVYGQPSPLTITGSVPSGKAGEKVALLTSTCGFKGSAELATLTTGPGGVFRYRFTPALGATFALRWHGRTSAGKTVRVQPQVAVVRVGRNRYRVDVSTANGVFLTGTKVALQALAGGHWRTIGATKLVPNSPVDVMTAVSSGTISKSAAGKQLRAVVPQTTCYTGATSPTVGG